MAKENSYGSIEDFWKSFSGPTTNERINAMTWCQIETVEEKAEYRFYVAVKNIYDRTFIVAAAKDVADRNNPCKPKFDTANDFEWMYDVLSCLAEKFKKKFPRANVRVGGIEYGNVNL